MLRRHIAIVLTVLLGLVGLGVATAAPAMAAAPTITSFTPTSGTYNRVVTITGTNFTTPATVTFGIANATVVNVVSATSISATVPSNATTGPIKVTTSGGKATSTTSFTVTPGLYRTPVAGPPTTTVSLSVLGFRASEAVDIYFDTTDLLMGVTDAYGRYSTTITVPASASPGTHWITAVGRASGSATQTSFTVRTDWSQDSFDNSHTDYNRFENTLTPSTIGELSRTWGTSGGLSYGRVVLAGGVLYAMYVSGDVIAYDATTGAVKWDRDISSGTTNYGTPTVSGGTVYVGSDDDNLYALNAATGVVRWKAPTSGVVQSTPAVGSGNVYFSSHDGSLYAVNAVTGHLVWSRNVGGGGNNYPTDPTVVGNWVYVGATDDTVHQFTADMGDGGWVTATSGAPVVAPIVRDGRVYVGTYNGNVYGLRVGSGAVLWTNTTGGGGSVTGALALYHGLVYADDTGGAIAAFDGNTGEAVWSTIPSPGPYSPVTVAGGVVYAANSTYAFAFDPASGARLRTLPVGAAFSGLIVADGALYGLDADGFELDRYDLSGSGAASVAARPNPASLVPTR